MDPKTAVAAAAVKCTAAADLSQILLLLLLLSLRPFLQRHNLNALSYSARTNTQREPYSAAAVTLPFEDLSRMVNELNTSTLCYITYRTTCDGVPQPAVVCDYNIIFTSGKVIVWVFDLFRGKSASPRRRHVISLGPVKNYYLMGHWSRCRINSIAIISNSYMSYIMLYIGYNMYLLWSNPIL